MVNGVLNTLLIKRYSENMPQIYMRTPMSKCDFNKVSKKTLLKSHFGMGVHSPVKVCIFFIKSFPITPLVGSVCLCHGLERQL